MHLSELSIDDANAAAVASTLIRTFRQDAYSLAAEQAAKLADRPDLAARWQAIVTAISILNEANVHMETALEMLDGIDENDASIHLDRAIVALGVRPERPIQECLG